MAWDYPLGTTPTVADWRGSQNDAFDLLLTNHIGTTEPPHYKAGSTWFDTTTTTFKVRKADNSGWFIAFTADVDYGGYILADGTLPMTGDLDLDGNALIIDADGDLQLVEEADDIVKLMVGATEVLRIDAAAATKTLDLQDELRLKDPEGFTNSAPGSATCYFLVETTAGTKRVMCANN